MAAHPASTQSLSTQALATRLLGLVAVLLVSMVTSITALAAEPAPATRDWDAILKSKEIRFVVGTMAASYAVVDNKPQGFDYELAKAFADKHGLKLTIIVAPDNFELINYVVNGKADVAAGFLTPTPERQDMGLAFSHPYNYATQYLVVHKDDNSIKSFKDLKGRTIVVRATSSYWSTVQQLRFFVGLNANLVPADETLSTPDVIERVGKGEFDTTVADSHILALELAKNPNIKKSIEMSPASPQAWAVSTSSTKLLNQIDAYIDTEYNSPFYKSLVEKYFKGLAD